MVSGCIVLSGRQEFQGVKCPVKNHNERKNPSKLYIQNIYSGFTDNDNSTGNRISSQIENQVINYRQSCDFLTSIRLWSTSSVQDDSCREISEFNVLWFTIRQRKSLRAIQVAHQVIAYPGFHSMKQLGLFLLPPGWDASPLCNSRKYPYLHHGPPTPLEIPIKLHTFL